MKSQQEKYEGSHTELQEKEGKIQLLIDNKLIKYGQMPDGSYFLYDYAYDPSDNLMDLARKFIKHRNKANKIRQEQNKKGGK